MVIPCLLFAQSRLLSMEEATLSGSKLSAKNALVKGYSNSSNRDAILKLSALNEKLRNISEDTLTRFPAISVFKTDNFSFTQINKTGTCILDVFSSTACAHRIDLLDASGKTVQGKLLIIQGYKG